MSKWITDRLPTEADADEDGDVTVQNGPGGSTTYFHWSMVVPGMAWTHTDLWEGPSEPALAVGQRWRRRDGKVVTVDRYDPNVSTTCPFGADTFVFVYALDDTAPGAPDVDLVELVEPATEPEPAQLTPRRFASINRTVWMDHGGGQCHTLDAIADDGTAWWMVPGETEWQQLSALPDREASADA